MDDLISKLSEIRSEYNCFDEAERQYYHALSEAIRELSGRADGDTIYRQDAIDGVKTLHDVAWKNWHEPTLSANVVLDMIGELPSAQPERPTGEWLRMSDLSEKDDNRYKCSRCGNVIHHKSRMDLYTFNSWCGRCGSDNSRHTTIIEADKSADAYR